MAKQKPKEEQQAPKKYDYITKITVAGFKSIAEEQSVEIRPLTILAGANSSGKSSIMQPLLLLKQTLEAPYDPGALLLKDFHLIEAALQTDKTVISVDETVRLCFHTVAQRVHILKHIIWVNPCKDDELCIEWLHNGAESEQKRLLGHEED